MKKTYRIKKNEEFSKIIASKHYFSNASYIIYFMKKVEDNARVGISVSKKLGDAVVRNKIKRQVRMMFLDIFDFENENFDLVCIVRGKYKEFDYAYNKSQLEKLVKKVIISK